MVGQEHVTEPLSTALDTGRISHAYLFSGPRGCGKTSSARILARSLNCVHGPTSTPCGTCASCVALGPGGAGNLDVIELDAASHGGVDDTRELRDRAFYAPAESRYRVFIVDEAHMVTTAGFNALLKIVEEPPAHLIFIFATTEPDKVLPTIRSRTHHYPFRLLPPATMRGLLGRICEQEHVPVEDSVYPLVIRAGGGSPRDSLSVLDQLLAGAGPEGVTYPRAVALLGVTDIALIDDAIDALSADDGAALFGTVDRVMEAGHDPRRFAVDLLERLRDLILLRAVPDAAERGLVSGPGDVLERMRDQAGRLGPATLARYAELLHEGLGEMRGATAPRLLLEVVCARMLLPSVSDAESATLQRLERLERGFAGGAVPAAPGGAPAARQRPADPAGERETRSPAIDSAPPAASASPRRGSELLAAARAARNAERAPAASPASGLPPGTDAPGPGSTAPLTPGPGSTAPAGTDAPGGGSTPPVAEVSTTHAPSESAVSEGAAVGTAHPGEPAAPDAEVAPRHTAPPRPAEAPAGDGVRGESSSGSPAPQAAEADPEPAAVRDRRPEPDGVSREPGIPGGGTASGSRVDTATVAGAAPRSGAEERSAGSESVTTNRAASDAVSPGGSTPYDRATKSAGLAGQGDEPVRDPSRAADGFAQRTPEPVPAELDSAPEHRGPERSAAAPGLPGSAVTPEPDVEREPRPAAPLPTEPTETEVPRHPVTEAPATAPQSEPVAVQPAGSAAAQPAEPVAAQPVGPVAAQSERLAAANPAEPVAAQPAGPAAAQSTRPVAAEVPESAGVPASESVALRSRPVVDRGSGRVESGVPLSEGAGGPGVAGAGEDLLQVVEGAWAEIKMKVREFGPTLQALLSGAAVSRVEGGTVVFAHQSPPLAQRLSDPRNLTAVRSAVRAVLGRELEVRWEAGVPAPRQAPTRSAVQPARGAAAGREAAPGGSGTAASPRTSARPQFSRPSQAKGNQGGQRPGSPRSGDDDIPPPDFPDLPDDPGPGDFAPPPQARASADPQPVGWSGDGVPPPPTPEEEQEMFAAAAEPVAPGDRRDPDDMALALLRSELGATTLEG